MKAKTLKPILGPDGKPDQTIQEKGMKKFKGLSNGKAIHIAEEGRDLLKMMEKLPGLRSNTTLQTLREAIGADAFDSLTLDRMYKSMLSGYNEVQPQWEKIVSKRTPISDFHTHHSVIRSGFNRLPEVKEKGAYLELERSDDQISWTPTKYGGLYGLSFEATTYDNFGFFDQDVADLGRAAARTLDYFFFYTCLFAGPTSYDGSHSIFDSTFSNARTDGGLNMTNLETSYEAMMAQAQLDSSSTVTDEDYMSAVFVPRYLIVDPTHGLLAKRLLATPNFPGSANNDVNVLNGELEIIVSPYAGATYWYLMADPGQGANTMEAGLWGGNASPELFYEAANSGHNFAFDEVRTKIRTIFGGGVLDPRAWLQNTYSS